MGVIHRSVLCRQPAAAKVELVEVEPGRLVAAVAVDRSIPMREVKVLLDRASRVVAVGGITMPVVAVAPVRLGKMGILCIDLVVQAGTGYQTISLDPMFGMEAVVEDSVGLTPSGQKQGLLVDWAAAVTGTVCQVIHPQALTGWVVVVALRVAVRSQADPESSL